MYRWNMVSWGHSRDGGGAPWVKYLNPRTSPKLGVAVRTCSPRTWASWWKQAHPHSRGTHIHKRAKLLKKRSQEHKKLKKYASWAARRFSLLRHLPTTWRPKLIPWNPRDKNRLSDCRPSDCSTHVCVRESSVKIIICLSFCVFVSCEYIKTLLPGNETGRPNDICSRSYTLFRRAFREPTFM